MPPPRFKAIKLQWTPSSSLSLFLTTLLASFQDFWPNPFFSLAIVFLHVVLGQPTSLRSSAWSSGFHVNAVIQSLSSSFLSTCSIHFHLLILTSALILLSLVLLSRPISSLDMTYSYLIFNILLKYLNMKVSILLLSTSLTLHASHPYRSTDLTSALKSLILVLVEYIFDAHIFLSFMNTVLALQIPIMCLCLLHQLLAC